MPSFAAGREPDRRVLPEQTAWGRIVGSCGIGGVRLLNLR